MRLRLHEPPKLEEGIAVDAVATRDDVVVRVRRFAMLRAAHRALSPSTDPGDESESDVIASIRERLGALTVHFYDPGESTLRPPVADEISEVDGILEGFARSLRTMVERLPLAQLRASLSGQTHAQRVEVAALLELCLEAQPTPNRYLRVVDFLVTLLSTEKRDGRWVVAIDPANLNDTVRAHCEAHAHIDTAIEARVVGRFQEAAERVASGPSGAAVMEEISAYKIDVAGFYFNPAVLRCIVGYNAAARNHVEERMQRGRQADAAIDDELGLFAPLVDQDPKLGSHPGKGLIPPHESPGVLAVQEAIRRRLLDAELAQGPAERIAAELDLGSLERVEHNALLDPGQQGIGRVIRTTVVLGHLAMTLSTRAHEFLSLGLRAEHLDAWICALGVEVQSEIDTLIRDADYDGAVRLGDVKSRYLAGVLLVARRRLGRNGASPEEADTFERDAIDLLREHLERERLRATPPVFHDLFGGGWRRTVAFWSLGLLVASLAVVEYTPSSDPRQTRELEPWRAREISSVLSTAYRDYADEHSMFVGTLSPRWAQMSPAKRRQQAEAIRAKVLDRGVEEVLLFDEHRVLQAHFFDGAWRTATAWQPRSGGGSRPYGPPRPK